jgi:hypothetical protein
VEGVRFRERGIEQFWPDRIEQRVPGLVGDHVGARARERRFAARGVLEKRDIVPVVKRIELVDAWRPLRRGASIAS